MKQFWIAEERLSIITVPNQFKYKVGMCPFRGVDIDIFVK